MRADVVFGRSAHLFICDTVPAGDAEDITVASHFHRLYPPL